jgi:protein gp37
MASRSAIEWTEVTWNPTTGCDRISPGCDHCYALTLARRLKAMGQPKYQNDGDPRTSGPGFRITVHASALVQPYTWPGRRVVFVNSMSDLFHVDVPDHYIDSVFGVMHLADWHVYQVLTKRAERMQAVLSRRSDRGHPREPHIWLGVSVENRKHGLPRLDHLRETPAAIRFLSVEPLLEDLGELDLDGIDWVIVGGESGPGARPMHAEWVMSIQQQCVDAGVPFFFKQWGGVQKSRFGRELEGRTWNELPPLPRLPVPAPAERKRRREIVERDLARRR